MNIYINFVPARVFWLGLEPPAAIDNNLEQNFMIGFSDQCAATNHTPSASSIHWSTTRRTWMRTNPPPKHRSKSSSPLFTMRHMGSGFHPFPMARPHHLFARASMNRCSRFLSPFRCPSLNSRPALAAYIQFAGLRGTPKVRPFFSSPSMKCCRAMEAEGFWGRIVSWDSFDYDRGNEAGLSTFFFSENCCPCRFKKKIM